MLKLYILVLKLLTARLTCTRDRIKLQGLSSKIRDQIIRKNDLNKL